MKMPHSLPVTGTGASTIAPQGNQVGLIGLSAQALSTLVPSPLEHPVWNDCDTPISADNVLKHVRESSLLPPGHSAGVDGHEKRERQVAWCYANSDDWEPLVLMQQGSQMVVVEGQHQLAAALLLGVGVMAIIVDGCKSHVSAMLEQHGGEWLITPDTEVFGLGVFPADVSGMAGVRVTFDSGEAAQEAGYTQALPSCVLMAIESGTPIAAYGLEEWVVGAHDGKEPGHPDGDAGTIRWKATRGDSHTERQSLSEFIRACESVMGLGDPELGHLLRGLIIRDDGPFLAGAGGES